MMPMVAAWKNHLVQRVQEQGGVYHDIVPTWSTFAGFKTHFGYAFTIPTSGNILKRLYRLNAPVCYVPGRTYDRTSRQRAK